MRFLPRFSLRILLLALTIFLIVFAVGVKYWRAYQEHERIANKLEILGFVVEEESDTLCGYVIAKRISGLQASFASSTDIDDITAVLQEIPEKRAVKRVSCEISNGGLVILENLQVVEKVVEPEDRAKNPALLRAIAAFAELEVLDLSITQFDAGQLPELAALKKLQSLKLHDTQLPQGELPRLLPQLPNLRRFHIDARAHYKADELLRLALPELTLLSIRQLDPLVELPLTKSGLGQMPKLAALRLAAPVSKIETEPGTLPHLRLFDLSDTGPKLPLDWASLLQAVPNLEMLAMHQGQLNLDVAALLSAAPRIKHLQFAHFPQHEEIEPLLQRWELDPTAHAFTKLPIAALRALKKNRPDMVFHPLALFWIDENLTPPRFMENNWSWLIEDPRTPY